MDLSRLSDLESLPQTASSVSDDAWAIGSACLTGILLEVSADPKPGLVTPRSMGSHADMDLQTFMLTSAAIAPCFSRCAQIGLDLAGSPAEVLPRIRSVGRLYDRRLLAASNGINTQRGALFALGVTAAAAGVSKDARRPHSAEAISSAVADVTVGLVERELVARRREPVTAGEILYAQHGLRGIRGEVEDGFPTVRDHGLPALREALAAGASLNRALLHALVAIVAEAEDTTVVWRGGLTGLAFVRSGAAKVRALGGALTEAGLAALHCFGDACVARRLSPGGGADLLAVTVALSVLEHGDFPPSATARFEHLTQTEPLSGAKP